MTYMKSASKLISDIESSEIILSINNLNFSYSKKSTLLKNINLEVHRGEILGISGENGSGKSTFLKLLVGLLKVKSGEIKKRGVIGYSPQNLLLFENLTIMENFKVFGIGLDLTNDEIVERAKMIMKQLNFLKYEKTLVKNLSGGTKQKVNFGISLIGNPDVLVLDEPYQGMDYGSFKAFWDLQFQLREQGKSIIIVSHMIEDQSKFTKSLHLIDGNLQGCQKHDCPMGCEKNQ